MPLPWKKKDKEDEKKLTPEQRAKKKKIAAGLKKDSKFKKKFGERADEVRSRIANKMAQKNESVNPYKEKLYSLLENRDEFLNDISAAANQFMKNPDEITSVSRHSMYSSDEHHSARDSLLLAADLIHIIHNWPKEKREKSENIESMKKHIETLKRYLPPEHVDALLKKHFG